MIERQTFSYVTSVITTVPIRSYSFRGVLLPALQYSIPCHQSQNQGRVATCGWITLADKYNADIEASRPGLCTD